MGTVSSYDLAAVQSALGGSNPISINEYYRGGSYVPTTTTSTVTQNSTFNYNRYPRYYWYHSNDPNETVVAWANAQVFSIGRNPNLTSYTYGGYTYYRSTFKLTVNGQYGAYTSYYAVYRTYTTTSSINTIVPSSGTISLSQLYGARNP